MDIEDEIPDEFNFQIKINVIDNYAISGNDKDHVIIGTWAFKVHVKVNKELRTVINVKSENGKVLQMSESGVSKDNKGEMGIYMPPSEEYKNIRVVVEKPILVTIEGQEGTYDEVDKEVVFDQVINIEK